MNYDDSFNVIYNSIYSFLCASLILFIILYFLTKKLSINGLLDPFTLTYTFTYSTSYAVIYILYVNDLISSYSAFVILLMGVTFLVSTFIFSNINLKTPLKPFVFFNSTFKSMKLCRTSCIIIYMASTILIVYFKGFSIFTETNRFEDNRGIGPVVRIFEMATYFLICYFFIYIYNLKKGRFFYFLLFITFLLFNAIISGAKADLLFYILAALISAKTYGILKKINIKTIILIFFSSTVFALVILYFNFNKTLLGITDNYTVLNSLATRLIDRIISNGDMYYLGLPNDVYLNIEINNPVVTFISPVISYSITSKIVGYDTSLFEIGKQLLLYHYPDNLIAGGPVDHFDLFSFSHFGLFGGVIFIVLLSYILCFIKSFHHICNGNIISSITFTIIWMNSLSWLLKPGYILGNLFYIVIFYSILLSIYTLLKVITLKNIS